MFSAKTVASAQGFGVSVLDETADFAVASFNSMGRETFSVLNRVTGENKEWADMALPVHVRDYVTPFRGEVEAYQGGSSVGTLTVKAEVTAVALYNLARLPGAVQGLAESGATSLATMSASGEALVLSRAGGAGLATAATGTGAMLGLDAHSNGSLDPLANWYFAKNKTDRLKKHILNGEMDAARREAAGEVVARKADGTPWDHVTELRDAQNGLLNRINKIKRELAGSDLDDATRAALQRELSEASKLLDKTEEFLPR